MKNLKNVKLFEEHKDSIDFYQKYRSRNHPKPMIARMTISLPHPVDGVEG